MSKIDKSLFESNEEYLNFLVEIMNELVDSGEKIVIKLHGKMINEVNKK